MIFPSLPRSFTDLNKLGHENSAALDKAFSVLYKFSLSFSSVLRRSELLAATAEIREQLCLLYTDLISLVVDVAIRFYKTANGTCSFTIKKLTSNSKIRHDFRFNEP